MVRPLALTMPIVTVLPRPNGLPMATTYSPTRSASLEPSETARARSLGVLELQDRDVQPRVLADDLRGVLALVGELHLHHVGVVDDVRVGDDVPLPVDEEARTEGLLLHHLVRRRALRGASRCRSAAEERETFRHLDCGRGASRASS